MKELHADNLITIIDPDPEPVPPPRKPNKGEGWYQAVLVYYPYKENLDKGKSETVETMILAKSLLAAKQKASKWANDIRAKFPISQKYPIESKWEEITMYAEKGIHWKKKGVYFSCNPELYLVPNNVNL